MRAFEPDMVDWPSFLIALLVDSLIVWAPPTAVFFLAPEFPAQLLFALVLAGLVANAILYARGATLGTIVCGFRLSKQRRARPGLWWGLVLAMLTLGSVPGIIVLAGGNLLLGTGSDWFGDLRRYPLVGERTRRRRFLEAAENYWQRSTARSVAERKGKRRFKLVQMSPKRALVWLIPGVICSALVVALQHIEAPPLLMLVVAIIGLVPSVVILAWGTLKFRSYYEVKRTRADYWTMFNATVIQVVALAPSAFLYVTALHSADLLLA